MGVKAILGGRIIDGNGGLAVEPGTVLVEGDAIRAVGPSDQVEVPADAERIDASDKTVMPGVMDGHMHVTTMPENLKTAKAHLEGNLLGLWKLRQCLRWGTTTVANMGGCPENVALRDAIDSGKATGAARMVVFGMVNATGGHVRGRSADGPWEVRKAVREMILAGCDFIKTASSGGFMWEKERLSFADYTLEELQACVEEAHARGTRVGVHAHAQPGLNLAIRAGCDIIMHGAEIDAEALDGIAEHGLCYMPTLWITSRHVIERPSLPKHMAERMAHAHPIHRAGVRKAREMGIFLAAGTDGGPGSVMQELEELVSCGLSPMEAIGTATRNTAKALGLDARLGTIEVGKKADLLIVEGNPLANISCLTAQKNVLLVMKDGFVEVARPPYHEHLAPREA